MLAARYDAYGDPDVLSFGEVPDVHAGPGQVRVAVVASSVNPYDYKLRRGDMAETRPMTFPIVPGLDAAGVVDEVGDGVEGVAVGDEVFGLGGRANAEYAVLDLWAGKPAGMSWAEAAAAGLPTETGARAVEDLDVRRGDVVLVEGAAGAVGQAAVQFARRRGATVIGTASARNHDLLHDLGAIPTTYGPGLADRVRELAVGSVTHVLDTIGSGSLPDLIAIVGDPARVVSVADSSAPAHGARLARQQPRAVGAFAEAANAHERGEHRFVVSGVYPLAQIGEAHRLSESGHAGGKVVLAVQPGV